MKKQKEICSPTTKIVALGGTTKPLSSLRKTIIAISFISLLTAPYVPFGKSFLAASHLALAYVVLFLILLFTLLEFLILKATNMVNGPLGSMIIDDQNNLLTIRWGYPKCKKEKSYKLSSLNAIELMVLDEKPEYGQLYLRLGRDIVPLPSAIDPNRRHEDACKLAETLAVPVFRLRSISAEEPVISALRLPYYRPTSSEKLNALLVEGDRAEGLVSELETELLIEEAYCPFCGSSLSTGSIVGCVKCATPHHRDCFEANGKCTTYSCDCCEFVVLS